MTQLTVANANVSQLLRGILVRLWARPLFRIIVKFYGAAAVLGVIARRLMTKAKDVKGKTILITGGGGGLGKAMAIEFARRGTGRIILWDINSEALTSVQTELQTSFPGVEFLTGSVDLSKREAIYTCADDLLAKVGFVDIVINNAGIIGGKPLLDIPDRRIQMVFDVNSLAPFWLAKKFLPGMMERNEGHYVVVSSLSGIFASPMMVDYSASKFAAKGFTDALRMELQKLGKPGVKTLVVTPAAIKTDLFKGFDIPGMPAMRPEYVAGKIADAIKTESEWLLCPYILPMMGIVTSSIIPVWLNDLFNRPASNTMANFDSSKADTVFQRMEANRAA